MTNNLSRSRKRRLWEKLVEQCNAAGLSQAEYCRQNRISIKSFQYWKRKIERDSCVPALVELPLKPSSAAISRACPLLCVVVGQHFRIEVERGFDTEDFERVVRVLRRI